tara:strand:- start:1896 stop:2141 length:246 start_codon:yes stop_codon:yes gene_type:complete
MSSTRELGELLQKLRLLKSEYDQISQRIQNNKDEVLRRLGDYDISQIKINSKNEIISTMTTKTRTKNESTVVMDGDGATSP